MRISDWSSDVCSSDLLRQGASHQGRGDQLELPQVRPQPQHRRPERDRKRGSGGRQRRASLGGRGQLHRAAGGKASGLINEGDQKSARRKGGSRRHCEKAIEPAHSKDDRKKQSTMKVRINPCTARKGKPHANPPESLEKHAT